MPTQWTIPTENSRAAFQQRKEALLDLCARLDAANDFPFDDWEILFHFLENYQPDMILEVGRGAGNTTCVFLDYCSRHQNTKIISVDLYDNWHQHSIKLLPQTITEKADLHTLLHQDFTEFEYQLVSTARWEKLLIFWDLSDVEATERLCSELLPMINGRNAIIAIHDVGFKTGRPQRYHWREYESLYPDIEIIGRFADKAEWSAGVPLTEQIFGQYRIAGYWLMLSSASSGMNK